jgi:uncharacterized protein (TIGR03435 family)
MFRRTAAQLLAAVCGFATCAAMAQSSEGSDLTALGGRFARAAITEHGDTRRYTRGFYYADGELTSEGAALITLISTAYGTKEFLIVDAPDWVRATNLYDINADPPPPELVKSDATQMLRALLADRFKLELQETTRELPVLALEFAEESPALLRTEAPRLQLAPGQKEGAYYPRTRLVPGEPVHINAELTLPYVATSLSKELQRNVVDMTGLDGIWTMDVDIVAPTGPRSFQFAALLEQLGLRLTERTVPLDVLAIKHVERPQLDAD